MARAVAMAVVAVARRPVVATVRVLAAVMAEAEAEADLAEVPALRTRASRAKTPVMDNHQASPGKPRHRASAMHKHRVSTVNNSARTHVAHA